MDKLRAMLLFTVLLLGGCSSGEAPEPVRSLDLEKYCGRWYEAARLPNWFEDGMTNVSAEYSLAGGGKIKVVNRGWKDGKLKEITGWARRMDDDNTGALEVSFFRPFYGEYKIIYFNPERTAAVVTSSSKKYLWILAREKNIPENQFREIIHFIEKNGFSEKKLIIVDQNSTAK